MKTLTILLLLIVTSLSLADMRDYEGGWVGKFDSPSPFTFDVSLNLSDDTLTLLQISNGKTKLFAPYAGKDGYEHAQFSDNLFFDGIRDSSGLRGFIQSGVHQYHVQFSVDNFGDFNGKWSPFFLLDMDSRLMLSIENANGENYAAYLILGDSRAPRLMCGGFQKDSDTLRFADFRTGMMFRAVLAKDSILFTPLLGDQPVATFTLYKTTESFVPHATANTSDEPNDGWQTGWLASSAFDSTRFALLEDSIAKGSVTNTHSVLVARHGKLVYEKYFAGYDSRTVHDLRSAQKTFTGAAIGVALSRDLIAEVERPIAELLPKELAEIAAGDAQKSKITLEHLLTMSSGIDAVDFGTDQESIASEDAYQQTENWPRTILETPMLNDPGTHANYGSANACLAGVILDNVVNEPVQLFYDEALFRPLGITDYILQTDFSGATYGAGGMFMTPRDMLKIGQLYLNGGEWNGRRVLSQAWIEKSWQQHSVLENTEQKNDYGYFWWRKTYTVNRREILSHEARGAGGQYIFVIPEFDLVVAITSGNFRNGRYWQPEKIVEDYILPALQAQ